MTSKSVARTLIALGVLILLGVILSTRGQLPRHEQNPAESGDRVVASMGTRLDHLARG